MTSPATRRRTIKQVKEELGELFPIAMGLLLQRDLVPEGAREKVTAMEFGTPDFTLRVEFGPSANKQKVTEVVHQGSPAQARKITVNQVRRIQIDAAAFEVTEIIGFDLTPFLMDETPEEGRKRVIKSITFDQASAIITALGELER